MLHRKLLNLWLCLSIFFVSSLPTYPYVDKDFKKLEKDFVEKTIAKGDFSKKDDDGKVLYVAKVSNKLLNGPAIINYSTGKIKYRGVYKNSLLDGTLEHYNKQGQLLEKQSLKQGLLNGKTQIFKDGVIREEFNYREDLKHGSYKSFDKQGVQIEKGFFQNGKLLSQELTEEGLKAKIRRKEKVKKIYMGIVGALIIGCIVLAIQNSSGGGGGSTRHQYDGFYCNQSLEGCCSYHQGILATGYASDGTVIPVTVGNRVVCNDRQLSPSCYCYPD